LRTLVLGASWAGEVFGAFSTCSCFADLRPWHHIWEPVPLAHGRPSLMPFVTYGIFKYRLLNVKIIATRDLGSGRFDAHVLDLFTNVPPKIRHPMARDFLGRRRVFGFLLITEASEAKSGGREEVQRLATELASQQQALAPSLDDLKTDDGFRSPRNQIRRAARGIRGYLTMFRDRRSRRFDRQGRRDHRAET